MNELTPQVPAQIKDGRIELEISRFGSSVIKKQELDEKENKVNQAAKVTVAGFAEKPSSRLDKFLECFGYSRWVPMKVRVDNAEKNVFVNVNSLAKRLLVSADSIRKASQQNELETWVKVAKTYTAIKNTFPGQLTKAQIRYVCKQIEANGKTWVESIKKDETFSTHDFKGIPVSVQVHSDSEIYISFPNSKEIGKGSFKVVRQAIKYDSAETVADAVSTKKKKVNEEKWIKDTNREIVFMDVLKPYPNIVKYHKVTYATDDKNAPAQRLLMPLYNGGELYKRIPNDNNLAEHGLDFARLTNANLKNIMQNTLTGISGMHKEDIVHHDIKPENILLSKKDDVLTADISDLGLAQQLTDSSTLSRLGAGTLYYLPPEYWASELREHFIKAPMDIATIAKTEAFMQTTPEIAKAGIIDALKAKDVWALGITFYEMISGREPDYYDHIDNSRSSKDKNSIDIPTGCATGMVKFREHLAKLTNIPVYNLIYQMTDLDPTKRITAEQALKIAGELNVDKLYDDAS